jgi:hypothetical protein
VFNNPILLRLLVSVASVSPAPERSRKTTWKEFLSRDWEQVVASDLFTIEVLGDRGGSSTDSRKAADWCRRFTISRRNHQGLGNRLIIPPKTPAKRPELSRAVKGLGGMLNYREAAWREPGL